MARKKTVECEQVERNSPEWSDYLLSQLSDDEKNNDGYPFVAGLRRLASLYLPPMVESSSTVVQVPNQNNGMHATAQHRIVFDGTGSDYSGYGQNMVMVYQDVADAHPGNTSPDFIVHASATAATKAEARALRKALGIKKVAADEISTVAVSHMEGYIDVSQIKLLDKICRDVDVNLIAFINSGSKKYNKIEDITAETASRMCSKIQGYLQEPDSIPKEVRGYNYNWRD